LAVKADGAAVAAGGIAESLILAKNAAEGVRRTKAKAREIWQRFPKFIIGFVVTFIVGLYLALGTPAEVTRNVPAAIGEANTFRVIFFILTFFSIGVLSDFKLLWQVRGLGRAGDFVDFLPRRHS